MDSWVALLAIFLLSVPVDQVSAREGGAGRRTTERRGVRGPIQAMPAFRDSPDLTPPIDPLFTDQREIRLSFSKDRLWSEGRLNPSAPKRKTPKNRLNSSRQPFVRPESFGRKDSAKKPNIILFLTDDQDIELGSLEYMPKTRAILKDGGAFFPNSFVSTPMCCPSRSSLLTGLFVHNHGVLTNNDNCSSAYWQAEHEPRSFGAYLASAGYRTGYFGKYLNKYNGSYIPPGWREWAGQVMNSRYYNYTINFNGQKIKHGFDYATDYYPDLITNDSVNFLRQHMKQHNHQPFLLVMSYPAPHGPEDSAPQHAHKFFNVTGHRTPAYDFAPNPDKQWILRWLGKMKPVHQRFTDLLMTKRLQTLQSVDDSVERIYRELVATGQLDNTYMFYTSDHGYHLGQFGLIKGKSFPFDFDTRVPFLVRGPGISSGRVVHSLVGNVDLAPTFLEIAGVPVPPHMDGASLFRFFQKKQAKNRPPWRDSYLLERGKMPPAVRSKLQNMAVEDANSEGAEGDDADGVSVEYSTPRGKFERWAVECQKPQYQSPCIAFQKYECLFVNDRWKMKRCRPFSSTTSSSSSTIITTSSYRKIKKWCKCKALSKYRLSKLEPEERRMQRAFLKEHTTADWRQHKPRFLKTVAGSAGRFKRKALSVHPAAATAVTDGGDGSVLRDVAEDELEQVELIMEDISDEIFDLEATLQLETDGRNRTTTERSVATPSSTSSSVARTDAAGPNRLSCQFYGQNRINCSSDVYSDPRRWRSSRDYLDQQIRILRLQLDEMKVIRKHLREMRPPPSLASSVNNRPALPTVAPQHPKPTTTGAPSLIRRRPIVDASFNQDTLPSQSGHRRPSHYDKTLKPSRAGSVHVGHMRPEEAARHGLCRCDVAWPRETSGRTSERDLRQAQRRKHKEERLRRKRKKQLRKEAMSSMHNGQCSYEKMNCFSHDNDHWRTEPRWTGGPFCVCMNANNNTYWCMRTLNATHNSLYCEFVTGFVTYYDMRIDPYQLRNIAHTLTEAQLDFYHRTLEKLRVCRGADCFLNTGHQTPAPAPTPAAQLLPHPGHDNRSSSKLKPKRERFSWRQKRREQSSDSLRRHPPSARD